MVTSAEQNAWINQVAAGTGLLPSVVQAWTNTENGWGINNPLGVNAKPYASLNASAIDTINLIKTGSAYSGIRSSVGSSAQVQAQAIVASPWEGHNYANYSSPPPIVNLANSGSRGPSYRGLGSQTVAQAQAWDASSANTSSVQSIAGSLIPDVQSAVGLIGVIIVGLVFILGAFLLAGKDKTSNVQIVPLPI
jgi:hypothetical protein